MKKSKEDIAKHAYYKYLERGGIHGDDQKDWFEAERELKGPEGKIKKEKPVKKTLKTKKK